METIVEPGRGVITFIPEHEKGWKTVILISSVKGAKRANHIHKTDTHLMHIISGKARYVEKGVDQCYGFSVDREVGPGDEILTVPGVPHAMEFLEDTLMLVCSINERQPEKYLDEIIPSVIL